MTDPDDDDRPDDDLPEHLREVSDVFSRREDGSVVEAPDAAQAAAREYPRWPEKGATVDGKRITVVTAKSTYEVGEEVHVVHVFEATEPGEEVYIMGPKQVHGEYVDGSLATPPPPDGEEPWIPQIYDGPTKESPAVDYNYEVTAYRFSEPGRHEIVWRLGPLESNTLEIAVVEPT